MATPLRIVYAQSRRFSFVFQYIMLNTFVRTCRKKTHFILNRLCLHSLVVTEFPSQNHLSIGNNI